MNGSIEKQALCCVRQHSRHQAAANIEMPLKPSSLQMHKIEANKSSLPTDRIHEYLIRAFVHFIKSIAVGILARRYVSHRRVGAIAESIRKLNSRSLLPHAASSVGNTLLVGRVGGWLSAIPAALMWGYADHVSTGAHETTWIPGLNAFIHSINYGVIVELVHKVQELLQEKPTMQG